MSSIFSALAMACMYCGYFGIRSQQQLQANQSPLGMRLQCAPCPRHVVLIKELLCNNLICILLNVLQLAFMAGVLHISFGHSLYWVLGTTCLGSFAGNGLGLLIGSIASLRSEQKVTVLSCFVLLLSFLCGMMVPSVKYFVHVYAPFLEWINPCALLTECVSASEHAGSELECVLRSADAGGDRHRVLWHQLSVHEEAAV